MKRKPSLNRRDFLKLSAFGAGALALPQSAIHPKSTAAQKPEFPNTPRVARITAGKTDLYPTPDFTSTPVGPLYENQVLPWYREVVGYNPYRFVQRFIETEGGYIWSPHAQMCLNNPDPSPLTRIPDYANGDGFWVEVAVPYVELILANPPVRSPSFQSGVPMRLYYQQVIWVDEIQIDENDTVLYRLNERSGSYGDIFWARGDAFKVLTPEELLPISPELSPERKRIVININEDVQTLRCYEDNEEVYFCRLSAGRRADIEGNLLEKSATPIGQFKSSWKLHSIHMSGGASGIGWDLIGVAWPTFFATPGVAIHSTFWHSNFGGEYMSHGCVNLLAEDAKWVWRWTLPTVPYEAIEVRENWLGENLTEVQVVEVEY